MNGTLETVVFEACSGVEGGIEVPSDLARSYVPNDFLLAGAVPLTAHFGFTAFQCHRTVHGNATLGGLSGTLTWVRAEPANQSWVKPGRQLYVFDMILTDQAVVNTLNAMGSPAALGKVTKATQSPGGAALDLWDAQGPSVGLQFNSKHSTDDLGSGSKENRFYWFGTGPYHRMEIRHEDTQYQPVGGDVDVVRVSGSSAFHSAVGDARSFVATTMFSLKQTVSPLIDVYGSPSQ